MLRKVKRGVLMKLLGVREDNGIKNRKLQVSHVKGPKPLVNKRLANPLATNVEWVMGTGLVELDKMYVLYVGN